MTPEAIITALLLMFPHMSGHNRQCIETNREHITQQLREVQQPFEPGAPVPPLELTAAVAFTETHLGCDHNEGGNWGAPVDGRHRHTPGTHMSALRVLSRSYTVCGTWDGAVMRFRTGLCDPRRQSSSPAVAQQGVSYLRRVKNLIRRMQSVSGAP